LKALDVAEDLKNIHGPGEEDDKGKKFDDRQDNGTRELFYVMKRA
jgi:hypothetical protein